MKLSGKVTIITGAGSGLGRAGAELFAREGSSVVVADVNDESGIRVVKGIKDAGGEAYYVHADVSKVAEVKNMIEEGVKHYGKLNIFWHNAGVPGPSNIESASEEEYDRAIAVNVKAGYFGAKYALPELRKQGGGNIIFTGSVSALRPGTVTRIAYSSSKAALMHLSKSLAFMYAKDKIRVNCVCPGNINTPLWDFAPEQFKKAAFGAAPMGRAGEAHDIAAAALYLVSDDASYVTGSVLTVDGGLSI